MNTRKSYGRTFILTFSVLALTAASACNRGPVPGFDETLEAHIAAVEGRDMDGFLATISDDTILPVIFPDGSVEMDRAKIIEFHKTWFADPNWRMKIEVVEKSHYRDYAIALTKTSYRDTPDGEDRYAILSLMFAVEDGEWKLIYDQNTRIQNNEIIKD